MLIIPAPLIRRVRPPLPRSGKRSPTPPLPTAPVMVAASFVRDESGTTGTLSLSFDIAVDASGLVPAEVVVTDGPAAFVFAGAGAAVVVASDTIEIPMAYVGEQSAPDVTLDASASTGIVAVDGGLAWAGTGGDVVLPYAPPGEPAVVVSVFADGSAQCTITFDRAIDLLGPPDDGSIFVALQGPIAASLDAPNVLRLTVSGGVAPGMPWDVYSQPGWIATPIAWPQSGTF